MWIYRFLCGRIAVEILPSSWKNKKFLIFWFNQHCLPLKRFLKEVLNWLWCKFKIKISVNQRIYILIDNSYKSLVCTNSLRTSEILRKYWTEIEICCRKTEPKRFPIYWLFTSTRIIEVFFFKWIVKDVILLFWSFLQPFCFSQLIGFKYLMDFR